MTRPTAAVVGSGVAGLTAAYLLQRRYDVTLFEADGRLGGHAHTHELPTSDGGTVDIDTGFIVHNRRTYPQLLRLFGELQVATQESDMSMSVRCAGCGLEYAGARGLGGRLPLFAQRHPAAPRHVGAAATAGRAGVVELPQVQLPGPRRAGAGELRPEPPSRAGRARGLRRDAERRRPDRPAQRHRHDALRAPDLHAGIGHRRTATAGAQRRRATSASALVAAPPAAVFALLADPHRHHELDGSGSVRRAASGPRRLELGDRFRMHMRIRLRMHMRIRLPYRVTNRVVELEPDRRIAWCHFARAVWRYDLAPTDGGTRVTETFDWAGSRFARGIERLGWPANNARAIDATLRRLQEIFPP